MLGSLRAKCKSNGECVGGNCCPRYIDKQTGYPGVELDAATFQPGNSGTTFEVVQYKSHQ